MFFFVKFSINRIDVDEPDYINMLKVYGIIAFQFDIHPMLMTIEMDMQKKQDIGNAVCYGLAGNLFQTIHAQCHYIQ